MLWWHWWCIYIICGYQRSRHRAIWHKTSLGKRLPCLVDVVCQCIVVLSVTLHYFGRGTRCQCILVRLTEQEPMVLWLINTLKKCWMRPHVSTMDSICDPVVWCVHNGCESTTACLQSSPQGVYACIAIWG